MYCTMDNAGTDEMDYCWLLEAKSCVVCVRFLNNEVGNIDFV